MFQLALETLRAKYSLRLIGIIGLLNTRSVVFVIQVIPVDFSFFYANVVARLHAHVAEGPEDIDTSTS